MKKLLVGTALAINAAGLKKAERNVQPLPEPSRILAAWIAQARFITFRPGSPVRLQADRVSVNVPNEMKRYDGMDREFNKIGAGPASREILERRKRAFPRPLDPVYGEKIRNALKESINDTGSPLRYLLDIRTLESMMRQQDASKRQTSYQQLFIWLIQLNGFLRSHNFRIL